VPDDAAMPEKGSETVAKIKADLRRVEKLVRDPQTDLFALLPHAREHTILREALLVADHNAYHIGELVIFKRLYSK
jgi:hypothetical protein